MEVIFISSDSENEGMEVDSPTPPNVRDEVYVVDWNDDYVYPSIDYESNPGTSEATNHFKPKIEIENSETPTKQVKKNSIKAIIDNEETVNYNCDINSYISDTKTSQSPQPKKSKGKSPGSPVKTQTHKPKERQILSQEKKANAKTLKEQKKLEREKLKQEKKAEQLKQKAFKAVLTENLRNLKPEENIKFLKVHIDNEIINSACGGNIITLLTQNSIQYAVEAQLKSFTITWSKRKTEKVIDEFGDVTEKVESREEDQVIYVLDWQNAIALVRNNDLMSHVETVKSVYLHKKLTLIIYGLQKYFDYKKKKRSRQMKGDINDKKKLKPKAYEKVYDEAPNISRDQLEYALTELQLLGKHNSRLLETPEELSSLVLNFTKSLSQVEFKQEKQRRQEEYNLGFFVQNDSKPSVKVDKHGNGLLRLWQQQLCQFNSVGLETAQAIVSQVNSPLALVTQYENLSKSEGELLLQNIQIRRSAGILSSTRRVGPQLSKKIYNFYMSDDPELQL